MLSDDVTANEYELPFVGAVSVLGESENEHEFEFWLTVAGKFDVALDVTKMAPLRGVAPELGATENGITM